jgi:hypothetical protein
LQGKKRIKKVHFVRFNFEAIEGGKADEELRRNRFGSKMRKSGKMAEERFGWWARQPDARWTVEEWKPKEW